MLHMTQTLTSTAPSDTLMLKSLLATADPAGQIAGGSDADSYTKTAELVLEALRAGEETVMLMFALPVDTPVEAAYRFASAAQNWWSSRLAADARVVTAAA